MTLTAEEARNIALNSTRTSSEYQQVIKLILEKAKEKKFSIHLSSRLGDEVCIALENDGYRTIANKTIYWERIR